MGDRKIYNGCSKPNGRESWEKVFLYRDIQYITHLNDNSFECYMVKEIHVNTSKCSNKNIFTLSTSEIRVHCIYNVPFLCH